MEVLYSRRITLGLEIKADGRVCARMPRGIPSQAVMDFIKERQDWIVQKWFLMEEKRRIREQRPLPDYVGPSGTGGSLQEKGQDAAGSQGGLLRRADGRDL